ncbi:MAG: SPOR domain-containing protein [Vicingaceae bacterium]
MKNTLIGLFLFSVISSNAQKSSLEFAFDQARAELATRNIEGAINSLRKVYVEQPDNANINFLMGAAYTELPGTQEEAIYHLKKAVQNVNENYEVGSFVEKSAPIHVYYYLAIAMVEKDMCADADQAFKEFSKYKSKVDQYFIDEVDRHLQKCPYTKDELVKEMWRKPIAAPEGYDPNLLPKEASIELDTADLLMRGLVTEKLEYTTSAPLYGVQIGSNLNPSPTSSYTNVKNVDVFIDNQGIIRYVVGHFSYRKQAESLLESLQDKGFKDAFVVNVNNERKYSNEVISYNDVNLRAGIRGGVEYYVQLGAFRDTVPKEILDMYFEVDGIQEIKNEEMTVLVVGAFENYQEALNKKDEVGIIGFDDSFIVAYNRGKKVPLNEAINHTE